VTTPEYEPDEALRKRTAQAIHEAGPCDDVDCTNPNDRGYCDKRADAALRAVGPTLLARGYAEALHGTAVDLYALSEDMHARADKEAL
jgi:hypothetical protein